MKVSLFVTCLTDLFSPQVGIAVVDVLEHFGCILDFPAAQTCCGQPQFNNGFPADARKLAQQMIEVFESSEYVVTPSGSCCAMIREHYPKLFEADRHWQPRCEGFVAKTFEFVEFLTKVLKVDPGGLTLATSSTATFHYTCHSRGLGMDSAPAIGLLKNLKNISFVPLERSEQCCGFGGTFATKYPDISGAMVKDKVQCGSATGADTMIVNDAGCAMNIGGACHRLGARFKVRHIAEMMAEGLPKNEPEDGKPVGGL